MSTTTARGTIWVCVDCYFAHHGIPLDDSEPDVTPWALWDDSTAEFTAGMEASLHGDSDCDPDGECECEQLTFAWSPCEGCGSTLGGAREAMTWWTS